MFGSIDAELIRAAAIFSGAVAIDAMVFTVCDFEANSRLRRALRWAACVTVAHWLLAGVGLSGLWTVRSAMPSLVPILQVATAFLLCVLIAQIPAQSRSVASGSGREGQLGFAAKVWVVSVDALFVGAGESGAAGSWTRQEVFTVLTLLGPMILACVVASVAAARGVSRLVENRLLRAEAVAAGGAVSLPIVALPVFSYLLLCTLRGLPLI